MGYSKQAYEYALEEVRRRQADARRDAERRRAEVEAALPAWRETERALSEIGLAAVKAATSFSGTYTVKALRAEYDALNEKRIQLLAANGLTDADFEPKVTCAACGDTGYADGKLCDCVKNLARQYEYDRMNRQMPLKDSTFETFDLGYYQGADLVQMRQTFEFCRRYADAFSSASPSLLLYGKTGLGKTHLSLSIVNRALDAGFGVIYAPAQTLLHQLEKEHFGRSEGDTLELLTECDLLVIDDLGAEFRTAFTEAAVGNLLNNRVLNGKPTVISTNLTADELNEAYGERVMSRILGYYHRLPFVGADIRQQKRNA